MESQKTEKAAAAEAGREKISAVLNTYNAEQHLERVLEALKPFDEIVVCDMESTDSTVEIARRHGCRVVTFPKGDITICEPARNCAIQAATNPWVLVVDADELVSSELASYLYTYVNSSPAEKALMIPRRNMLIGDKASSTYPDYQCRFVRKDSCDWPPVIHARPVIDGVVGRVPSADRRLALVHIAEGLSGRFRKLCTYSDNEVERRRGKHVTLAKLMFEPFFRFFKSYILKGGIFRGRVGYIEAQNDCFYKYMVLCKLYEDELSRSRR